jgi:mannosylglycerate hydrolase
MLPKFYQILCEAFCSIQEMYLHLVSHTHWDREWHLTFQQFRLKLIHLVDDLLDLLLSDPDYRYFTLDGQTIILEDYLEIRPEREGEIRKLVQAGRLFIGPWYILPDEFLVSPEATVRNLLEGERISQRFGKKMNVGYLPDPFGHFGQMPQVLQGFDIETACLQRGLDLEPPEIWWQAPDGSRVFAAYLRDGYGNASGLPVSDPELFTREICRLGDSLLAFSAAGREGAPPKGHLLLMQGTDHLSPIPETPSRIAYANEVLDSSIVVHSSLPEYLKEVRDYLESSGLEIPVIKGELRSPRRFHLLPGVLSSRMWIKQRNSACENILEKWAEPFSTWAELVGLPKEVEQFGGFVPGRMKDARAILRYAWRLLMTCHPHDSICGCSIDQVHEEMRSRFDQVEQVGEEITRMCLASLAEAVDTRLDQTEPDLALVVFNPSSNPRSDSVTLSLPADWNQPHFVIIDERGRAVPHQLSGTHSHELMNTTLDKDGMRSVLAAAQDGRINGMAIRSVIITRTEDQVFIDVQVSEMLESEYKAVLQAKFDIQKFLEDPDIRTFSVRVRTETGISVIFAPQDVPPLGWKTYWVIPDENPQSYNKDKKSKPNLIENEYLQLEFDKQTGCFNLLDKRSGCHFHGLNRFEDGGDCGDEYNYSPPETDRLVDTVEVQSVKIETGPVRRAITAKFLMKVPHSLTTDRSARSTELVDLSIETTASLTEGLDRVDFKSQVENRAKDHRMRLFFPTTVKVDYAYFDGHFEVVRRPVNLPEFDESWIEEPRPESPQRSFTCLLKDEYGIGVSNRGLPEAAVLQKGDVSEIALTLLRCTGWLSRDDFSTRKGHAGPGLPTPGAQEQGKHNFEYAFLPFQADNWEAFFKKARNFSVPLRAVGTRIHNGDLPAKGSFVSIEPEAIEVSAVKFSEDHEAGKTGWILRGFNQSDKPVQAAIYPFRPFPRASKINLAEKHLEELAVGPGGIISLAIEGHEIFTILFREDN